MSRARFLTPRCFASAFARSLQAGYGRIRRRARRRGRCTEQERSTGSGGLTRRARGRVRRHAALTPSRELLPRGQPLGSVHVLRPELLREVGRGTSSVDGAVHHVVISGMMHVTGTRIVTGTIRIAGPGERPDEQYMPDFVARYRGLAVRQVCRVFVQVERVGGARYLQGSFRPSLFIAYAETQRCLASPGRTDRVVWGDEDRHLARVHACGCGGESQYSL